MEGPEQTANPYVWDLIGNSIRSFRPPRRIIEQAFNGAHRFAQSLFTQTAQGLPGDLLPGERLFKPTMHLMADVLAIAQAILNEWNFIAGQEVEIATSLAGNFFYLCAVRAHVAAMPEHGRKGIRVAHEIPGQCE